MPSNVFTSLDHILNFFQQHESKSDEIRELLNVYNRTLSNYVPSQSDQNHLFIVFEGLDGSGKTTLSNLTSKKLKGVKEATPPKSIQHLRDHFDKCEPKIRRAYYSLGNYMVAMEIEALLSEKHVVMDRFWHSTVSYALAESTEEIPPKGSTIYKWPSDLLKPDLVIFLTVEEHARISRLARRNIATEEEDKLKKDTEFRQRLYEVYENMEDMTNVDSNMPVYAVFKEIQNTLLIPLLQKHKLE